MPNSSEIRLNILCNIILALSGIGGIIPFFSRIIAVTEYLER